MLHSPRQTRNLIDYSWIMEADSEEAELTEILRPVASKWYPLGLQLELPTSQLDVIKEDNYKCEDKHSDVVAKWLEKTEQCRGERRDSLVEALKNMDEDVLARSVSISDCSSLSDVPTKPRRSNSWKLSLMGGSSTDDDAFLPTLKDEEVKTKIKEFDKVFRGIELGLRNYLDTKDDTQDKLQKLVGIVRVLPLELKDEYKHIKKEASKMKKMEDSDDVMDCLNDHWNFVDYHLLEHVINEFENEQLKVKMKEFTDKLKTFRKNISVKQFANCWKGRKSIPKEFRTVEITIDADLDFWSMEQLEKARVEMCAKLDREKPRPHPSVLAILVAELKTGSIIIVFAFPVEWLTPFVRCQKDSGPRFFTSDVTMKIIGIKISNITLDENVILTLVTPDNPNPDMELLRSLLESGYDPDCKNEKGQTPLMIVCKFLGRLDIVELLLDHKAGVNLHSTNNVTPLGYASYEGYTDIVELLLKEGADVNALNQVGRTALSNASSPGHVDTVRVLLQRGADATIDLRNQRGATPLHYAAQGGHLDVAELLLDNGASIEETNRPGGTALSIAIAAGHIDVANLLLSRGANVNTETGDNNQAPLMFATMIGDMEMVRLILKYHPEINARSKNGITALMLAVQGCHDDIVNTLLEQGADPNLAEKETGWSSLHVAVKHAHSNVAKMLFEHKAQPDVNDLSLAFDIMQVLLSDSNSRAMSEVFENFGFERDKHHKISEVSINEIHNHDETLHKVFTQHATELHIQEEPKNRFLFPERYVLSVGVPQQTTGIDSVDFQEEFKDSTLVPTRTKDYPHSGIFGYIERLIVNGEKCVGRKYRSDLLDYQDKKRLRDAIRRLEKLSHENIAKMKGVCFYDELTYPVIITEILDTTLDRKNLEKMTLEMRLSALHKVAKGLAYLHDKDVTHYSLTAQNVRVTESLDIVKIGGIDDGLIVDRKKLLAHNQDTKSIAVYMPPEVSNPELIYTQFDVFSFGHLAMCTVIGEFSTGTEILFPAEHVTAQEHHVEGMTEVERRQGYVSRLDDILGSGDYHSVGDLIKQCLRDEPRKRPKAQKLLLR